MVSAIVLLSGAALELHAANTAGSKESNGPLAIDRPETKAARKLVVTSPAFKPGEAIPPAFSNYEQDTSVPIAWSGAPPKTKSFVLIMEDPDAKKPTPHTVIHWVAWNIPASSTSLREGLPKQDKLDDPRGMRQGPGSSGTVGYRGPRPPAGDPPHHYHVQIFALERELELPPRSGRDEVLEAARGHVLASGEIVGTFKRPEHPSNP